MIEERLFCESNIFYRGKVATKIYYKILRHRFGDEWTDKVIFDDLKSNLRTRCYLAFKKIKENKPCKTEKILGASFFEVKNHIQKQFKDGMNWSNMGRGGWHIDHIKPLALAKTKDDLLILCHYSNLQPIWEKENLKKNSFYNGIRVTYKHNIDWKH